MFVCPPCPPRFYFVKLSILCLSLQVSDQAIKSSQSMIPQHGMQPDQTVLPLLQPLISEYHWTNGWLMIFPTTRWGRKKRERRKKGKTWDLDEAPYSRQAFMSDNRAKTQITNYIRDTQPSWLAGSDNPGPACGLQKVPLWGALQLPPSHLFSSPYPHTLPSYGMWGCELP